MNVPEVVTIGSATQDVFIMTKDINILRLESYDREDTYLALPYGAKIDVDDMFISTGGGATNTAFTFRRFGLTVAALAKIGHDRSGAIIRARLVEEGIDDSMIVVDPEHGTGYSAIVTVFTGERTVLVYRGATLHLNATDIDWERLGQAKLVFVGSLSGETSALYPKVAEFCAEHGIFLAANPGSTQFRAGLKACHDFLRHLDVLFMNKEEAYLFTGIEPRHGPHDEREMLQVLRETGAQRVVITEGAKGCQALDETTHYTVPACKVKVKSTLGAGDAFAAGCTAALYRGEPFVRALHFGTVNAASVVSMVGAKRGILHWEAAQKAVQECEQILPVKQRPA
ncbi:MAG: carbohydrate kinase family protein [Candidatus Zipacnadales bacterium]